MGATSFIEIILDAVLSQIIGDKYNKGSSENTGKLLESINISKTTHTDKSKLDEKNSLS